MADDNKPDRTEKLEKEAEFCKYKYNIANFLSTMIYIPLTLNPPIATKVACFSRLRKCLRRLYGKSVDPDQTAPIGAVCSGSTLFVSILKLGSNARQYLQQTTSAEFIFQMHFFSWRFKG